MTMENSSRPMTSHPVHVTSHPALMHVGGMDLVGNYRASHGSGTVLFLPPAHVVCGKVMLSAVSVCQSVCRFTEVSHVTTTHDANGQLGAPPPDLFKLLHLGSPSPLHLLASRRLVF